jgi:hypothetical protein
MTVVSDCEGRDTRIPDTERDGRFPCRLYGWSEIERLGRRADHLRDVLDHMLDLHSLLAERDQLLSELSEDRIHLEALAAGLERLYEESDDLKRLREVKQSFDLVKNPDVEPLFTKVDSAAQALTAAKRWESNLTRWAGKVQEAASPPQPVFDQETQALWTSAKGGKLLAAAEKAASALVGRAEELVSAAAQLRKACEQRSDAAVSELERKLEGKADVADLARRRSTIAKQLDRAREQERNYGESLASLKNGLADRQEKVSRLNELLTAISTARSEGVGRIEAALSGNGGPNIGIMMLPTADTTRYEEWLTSKLKSVKPYQARDRIIAALRVSFGPGGTTVALLQGTAPDSGLKEGDVDILRDVIFPFAEDVGSGVQRVLPEVLATVLECDECASDDRVQVTLDSKPIGDLSPGQRCSALLPIILLGSKAPLVLDQPEDNLDNQLITDLLIQTLHGLKEHRQVIVVTHNPNIVVTGDAEQVVVMEAADGKCRVRRQASVDRLDVMRDIVDLMEGGREALRRRFKRYWPEEEVPELSFLGSVE